MFQLEWPLVLLLLPLPMLVYYAFPVQALRQQAALRVPVLDDFRQAATTGPEIRPRRWRQWLFLLAWLLLVLAASRPQWIGESIAIAWARCGTQRSLYYRLFMSRGREQQ